MSRRNIELEYGEGSTWFDAKRNRWVGETFVRTPTNARQRKRASAPTELEVKRKLVAYREQAAYLNLSERTPTVGELAARWAADDTDDYGNRQRTTNTADKAASDITKHVVNDPTIADILVTDLRTTHVKAWIGRKMNCGYQRSTVTKSLGNLRLALRYGVSNELVATNVAETCSVPKHHPKTPAPLNKNALTEDEMYDLVPACLAYEHHTWGALIVTALGLATRPSEVMGLRWSDVRLDAAKIRVAGAIKRNGNGVPIGWDETKNRKKRPWVKVAPYVIEALVAHDAQFTPANLPTDPRWADLVFPNPDNGQPWHLGVAGDHLDRITTAAGVTRITPHELRHTGVTLMLKAKREDWREVAYIAGMTERVMMDTYAHMIDETMDTGGAFDKFNGPRPAQRHPVH